MGLLKAILGEGADRGGYARTGTTVPEGETPDLTAGTTLGVCPQGTTFTFPGGVKGCCPCCGWGV